MDMWKYASFQQKYTVRNKKEVGIVYVRKWVNWGKTK